ncbi:MAG: hypothetical protein RBT72_06410 [Spirochaetia bacterium]|nr:hypothetical protein [Spirochaetales bacterium]MDX9784363.1 hypothetical protein [Spirochaetia bacterium]
MNEHHSETVEPPSAEADPFSSSGASPWRPLSSADRRPEAFHAA